MRHWINLVESSEENPTAIALRVRDRMIEETGETPHEINRGQCFEFADNLENEAPHLFQSMDIGGIYNYGGEWKDEPEGFDEKLLLKHWKNFKPLHGLTWKQMFHDVGLSWPGTHAWAYCKKTDLCYDIETPEGVANPFELSFFKPWFDEYTRRMSLVETEQDTKLQIRVEGSMIVMKIDGKDCGWFSIDLDRQKEGLVRIHSNIDPAYCRKGYGPKVYDWAEKYFASKGLKLVPFDRISLEAYRLWQKRNPEAIKDYRRIDNYYYSPEAAAKVRGYTLSK